MVVAVQMLFVRLILSQTQLNARARLVTQTMAPT